MGVRSRVVFGGAAALLLVTLLAFGVRAAGTLPDGWLAAGSAPQLYTMEIDRSTALEGHASVVVASKADTTDSVFGTAMQTIDAEHYRGKRVRFTARVKTDGVAGWSGLWMRIDGTDGKMLGFDNMGNRPIKGTNDWTSYAVVLDVPQDSVDIAFGMLVSGKGRAWLAKPEFMAVGVDTKTTNAQPYRKEPILTW